MSLQVLLLVLGELFEVPEHECVHHVRDPWEELLLECKGRVQPAGQEHSEGDCGGQGDRILVLPVEADAGLWNGGRYVHVLRQWSHEAAALCVHSGDFGVCRDVHHCVSFL